MPTRNPTWERDEVILALDLYFHHKKPIDESSSEIIFLSQVLNSLPIHQNRYDGYRNTAGVSMKVLNFRRLDPNFNGVGLEHGSKMDAIVWEEFSSDPVHLHQVAQSIINGYRDLEASELIAPDEDEQACGEGKVLYRLHRMRERNRSIVQRVKERAIRNGEGLRCIVCAFDFQASYGSLGEGFIECHHTKPISEYVSGEQTKVTDLRLVCSNCHSMLHKRRPWVTVDELRDICRLNNDRM